MKKTLLLLLTVLLLALSAGVHADEEYRFAVADDDLSITQGLDKAWRNILLIGSDNRLDEENQGRADALIICSLNKETGQIRLTSLSRDMHVKIAGQEFMDKINTAFRYGGPNLMMKTVNELFGLNIEDYVSINFYGLCDMVDAIGGVELTLTRGERDEVNRSVVWGYGEAQGEGLPYGTGEMTLTLCGAQALAYARIRNLDSDFGRNQRQRNVLMAIARRAGDLSAGEFLSLAKVCFEYITTEMSFLELVSLGTSVLKGGLSDMKQLSLPAEGTYRYASIEGKSVLNFDLEDAKKRVHEFIYAEQE